MRAALLLWLLCQPTIAVSQRPHPRPPTPPQQEARRHAQPADSPKPIPDSPPPLARPDSGQAAQPYSDSANEKQEEKLSPDTWIAGFLAFMAFLQLVVFSRQANRLRDSVDESRKATATIRDNAVSELRAYVTVGPPVLPPPALWTKGVILPGIEIQNAGRTPAYELAAAFKINVVTGDFDPRPFLPLDPDEVLGTKSRGMIGPRSEVRSGLPAGYQMNESELAEVRRGERRVYIYGTVRYRDAFKIERHTNYCCYLVLDGEKIRARTAEYGNDAE
jgi:hypothetical protein